LVFLLGLQVQAEVFGGFRSHDFHEIEGSISAASSGSTPTYEGTMLPWYLLIGTGKVPVVAFCVFERSL
jgi:hypothetical protein